MRNMLPKSLRSQKVLAGLILTAFLAVGLLSFSVMVHAHGGELTTGCLFSMGETVLCSQDALVMLLHHISSYQTFTNVLIGSNLMILFLLAILFALALFSVSRISDLLSVPSQLLTSYNSDFPPSTPYKQKIIHWLSLLENSPQF